MTGITPDKCCKGLCAFESTPRNRNSDSCIASLVSCMLDIVDRISDLKGVLLSTAVSNVPRPYDQ